MSVTPAAGALRPEQEALLCCARARLEPDGRERLRRLVAGPFPWDRLRAQADYHGLGPLVYRHLSACAADLCPPDVLRGWQAAAVGVLASNMRLTAELVALAELFRREGIALAALKGPVAAVACYGHVGARAFADLDLLVPEAQAAAAGAALGKAGYAPRFPLRPGWDAVYRRCYCECVYRREAPAATVDLHWGLLPPGYSFTPLAAEVWGRLEAARLNGVDVPTLGAEDTLLFLCLHAAKHDWSSLHWLCDIAELLRARPQLDWAWLRVASRGGAARLVGVGLRLARALLDAPVPGDALPPDDAADALAAEAAGALLAGPLGPPAGRWPWRSLYYRAMERRRDRWRLVHDQVLAPSVYEWRLLPLPPALALLYYAVRPVRLLAKEARARLGRAARPAGPG